MTLRSAPSGDTAKAQVRAVRAAMRSGLRATLLVVFLLAIFGATYAMGAADGAARPESQTTVADVEDEVMCPTCETTLDNSSSPAAERMRVLVHQLVAEGLTKDEVKDRIVDEYGGDESVLATPRLRGIGLFAWLVPFIFAAAALFAGLVLVFRWRRHRTALESPSQPGPSTSSSAAS